MQLKAGIEDTPLSFFADTIESGHGLTDPTLARALAVDSADGLEWARLHSGVDFNNVEATGGHAFARTHRVVNVGGKPAPVGWEVMAGLRKAVERHKDRITVRTDTKALGLVQADPNAADRTAAVGGGGPRGAKMVTGVRVAPANQPSNVTGEVINADAVILTTGGFGNDHTSNSLLARFAPELQGLPTSNGAFATGEPTQLR